MERKTHRTGRFLVRLLVLSLAGYVVSTLQRERPADPEPELTLAPPSEPGEPRVQRRLGAPRRLAVGLALTTIFFAGAALTAGAGNEVAGLLDQSSTAETTSTDASAPAAAPTDTSVADPSATAPDPSATSTAPADTSTTDGSASADPSASSDDDAPASGHGPGSHGVQASSGDDSAAASSSEGSAAAAPAVTPTAQAGPRTHAKRSHNKSQWVLNVPRAKHPARHGRAPATVATPAQVAAEAPGTAPVVWLNRTLPDPTPPSRRLAPRFAHRLVSISRSNHVGWPLVLGVLRAEGRTGAAPATRAELRETARALAAVKGRGDWNAALAVTGHTATADQAVALMHYNRAVGLNGLRDGLLAHKDALVNKLLHDGRATIYSGGRQDLASGRVDIRVVVLIEYLADTYGQVTVSCLISGHRLYARPGVISAHIYGRAVDIADVGGISIYGHQEPGGITERTVRSILLLPSELQPKQVISLLGLGGPSFPLANHYDHIHIGY
ncbi:MAG TPA: hypothetical protein VE596_03055 [Gaiellaceae bacterium]|jgi:hypothetical protein|nr:hypothetical protein [Gaiellaceae bacterium]